MLTKIEQKLLLEILLRGEITRKSQRIYKSKAGFFRAITSLKEKNLISSKKKENSLKNEYFLKFKGYVRANLIALDNNNGSRFNQVANPDIVRILEGYRKWIG